jgi:hypothetical protein
MKERTCSCCTWDFLLADMCRFMRELVLKNTKTQDLNIEERNLLSVAYKNVIGARRATWRTLNETIMQESQREDATFARMLHTYKMQVGDPPHPFSSHAHDAITVCHLLLTSYHHPNRCILCVFNVCLQIERELKSICGEVLSLLTDHLLKVTKGKRDEAEVHVLCSLECTILTRFFCFVDVSVT